jgi:hypothetical protein
MKRDSSRTERARNRSPVEFDLPCEKFITVPVPGVSKAHMGMCYVRVMDLPDEWKHWMEVNPRVPNTTKTGIVTGAVPKAIRDTLWDDPDLMALKNAGLFLLVDSADAYNAPGGKGRLRLSFSDPDEHGLVNGGHTFATVLDAKNRADNEKLLQMERAYVRLHIMRGVPPKAVVEIAEGLNRSKQVRDESLKNLDGAFETIKRAMRGKPGENEIAYYEGDSGEIPISNVLAFLQIFNLNRYEVGKEVPNDLYGRTYNTMKFFSADLEDDNAAMELLMEHTPEILVLADEIRKRTIPACKDPRVDFEIGRMKSGQLRVRSPENLQTPLHFLGEQLDGDPPKAWIYPMLAAFRLNVEWNPAKRVFGWKVSNDEILDGVMVDLVRACVKEHRDSRDKPEWVAKRSSTYEICSMYVKAFLDEREIRRLRSRASVSAK